MTISEARVGGFWVGCVSQMVSWALQSLLVICLTKERFCASLCSLVPTNVRLDACYLISQLFCLSQFFVEVIEAVDQILSVL